MALKDIFSRGRKPLDGPEVTDGAGVSPVPSELDENAAARRKQRMLLAGAAGIGVIASRFWIFGDNGKVAGAEDDKDDKISN